MIPFLVIDVETGGLDPRICGLTEIAAVAAERAPDWSETRVVACFNTLIQPVDTCIYQTEALNIQGRTRRDLEENGTGEEGALIQLHQWIYKNFGRDTYKISPWAHNAQFDLDFLRAAHERHGMDMKRTCCNNAYRCSMQLYRLLKELGAHHDHKANLDTVLARYDLAIARANRHTAAGDVQATALAIGEMMKAWRKMSTSSTQSTASTGAAQ